MSEVKVNKVSPRSGTTVTIGDSGDTINLVGTLQNNGSPLTGDISSVVAGTGLSGGATSGVATLNIEAAQPTITSLGTITGFTSTGIDDNADATAITIDSSEQIGIGTSSMDGKLHVMRSDAGATGKPGSVIVAENQGNCFVSLLGLNSDNCTIFFGDNNNDNAGQLDYDHANDSMSFFTNQAERMRIDSSGNVGIGISNNSSKKLYVAGDLTVQTSGDNVKADFSNGVNANFRISTAGTVAKIGPSTTSDVAFVQSSNEYMRIKADGKIGIGNNAPVTKLHIGDTSTGSAGSVGKNIVSSQDFSSTFSGSNAATWSGLQLVNHDDTSNRTTTGVTFVHRSSGSGIAGIISTSTSADRADIRFITRGTNNTIAERVQISDDGNLLVGCTAMPSTSVNGVGFDVSNSSEIKSSIAGTGNATRVRFFNGNGEVGTIRTNGSATAYNTSSDYRLKENVNYDFDATTRLKQLKPARFNFIKDADTTVDGFIAHEVSSIVPEAIHGTKDEVDNNSNPVYQGIDQSKLVPLLVKTIQELEARITTLENA